MLTRMIFHTHKFQHEYGKMSRKNSKVVLNYNKD